MSDVPAEAKARADATPTDYSLGRLPGVTAQGCFGGRCFGTDWQADLELDLFDSAPPCEDSGTITVRLVTSLGERRLRQVSPRMELADDGFRLRWDDEATFDAFTNGVINVLPGSQWCGTLPATFYSTVAAIMLAWRGLLPLHMSSVVLNGRALLIGGASGAGKSTLAAELIGAGAQFLADDLTVLRWQEGPLLATRGRSTMRLYPQVAGTINHHCTRPIPEDVRGKLLVWPRNRAADESYPIGGIIILDQDSQRPLNGAEKWRLLARCVFRPRIIGQTPAAATIHRHVQDLASTHRLRVMPILEQHDTSGREAKLARLLAWMAETAKRA